MAPTSVFISPKVSRSTPQSKVLRLCNRENVSIPDEQFHSAVTDYSRVVSLPLADRTFFQMDQATLTDQVIFRYNRKCSQDSDMDRNVGIRYRCHYEKTTQNRGAR